MNPCITSITLNNFIIFSNRSATDFTEKCHDRCITTNVTINVTANIKTKINRGRSV